MKNVNESGRSMVEMLGVLAIIGVLSIGGIAGYTMAMNRYRANEIIYAANLLAIEAIAREKALAYTSIGGTLPTGATEINSDANGSVTIRTNMPEVGALISELATVTGTCDETTGCKLDVKRK